jgi:tRNA nucleotidyltransferase (CCA-adding enzyme)
VFLHPETHEEYALARLERKTGPGYRGFATDSAPTVTLEQDLQRRDLTINAIARDPEGRLIDPYGGQRDLELRRLRHVSSAFVEDPLRVLRVARFAARFADLGFQVAPETLTLMRQMVDSRELEALVPERVWRETERALGEPHPETYFDCLQACGALAIVMRELAWDDVAREALMRAARATPDAVVRFAALAASGPPEALARLGERLRVPNEYRELAGLALRLLPRLLEAATVGAAESLELLEAADAFRRAERFHRLLQIALARASAADSARIEARVADLAAALALASAVALPAAQLASLKGAAIAATLHQARLEALATPHSARRKS